MLSVQLYSVRDALEVDPGGTLARLAELGFRNVEPFGLTGWAARLAEPLRALELAAPTAHVSLLGTDVAAALDAAEATGTELLVEPAGAPDRWTSLDGIRGIVDDLHHAADAAAERGVRVGYHNHWWELAPLPDGSIPLEVLAAELDDRVVLEVDAYWAAVGGVDPVALVERLGPRVAALHVKDGPITREPRDQVPAGRGRMPIAGLLRAAPHARPVIEFDDYADDLFEGIAESKAELERLGVTA